MLTNSGPWRHRAWVWILTANSDMALKNASHFFFNWKWPHTVRTTIYSTLNRKYFPFDNKPYLVKPRWLATIAKENKQSSVAIWHTARRYLAHASEKSARNSSHASWQQIDSCSRHWQRSLNLSSTNGVLNLDTCFVLKNHTQKWFISNLSSVNQYLNTKPFGKFCSSKIAQCYSLHKPLSNKREFYLKLT